ncbi:MAG: XRE family transcriptional regulator [Patescibacteria group bacterium]|nr:XRE family transcriptional regulator [Patescibacteria group bacterium]
MIGKTDIYTAARLFDPERLTLAREWRGLTKHELADKIGKTPSAVSQFESARARPDGQTIGRMMLALGVPASFFARTPDGIRFPVVPLDICHFRSLRSASQRDRRKLLAKGSLLGGMLTFLEGKVNLPEERVTMLSATPEDSEAIEDLAIDVRRRWELGLGPIGNMINLLERKGVVVIPIDESCREVDAFSMWNDGRPCVFLVMEKDSPSRTRMDAAHELGHLVMHADVMAGSPELEHQANRFGSALLMPRDSFYHEAPRRLVWEHIWELKRRWKTSAAAIIRRTYDLGLISDATYKRAFVQLSRSGNRPRERDEPARELPVAIAKALAVVEPKWPLHRIADELGLNAVDLRRLIAFTDPEELPEELREPAVVDEAYMDGPLFSRITPDKQ